jgi:predicted CxxxxCH...CXXCH cytochrome family protein
MKQIILILTLSLLGFIIASCSDDRVPSDYSTHIDGWMDSTSASFHGQLVVKDALNYSSCRECHAVNASDEQLQFCQQCHATYPHHIPSDSLNLHRDLIRSLDWQLSSCENCHGADFAGGRTGVSCVVCHTQAGGPASCTSCHGQPPVDDNTLPHGMASGAAGGHQAMAVERGYACTECHAAVTDLSHTGPLPAEVDFSDALISNARGYHPGYVHVGSPTSGDGTCAVYCHSNGRGGPPNQPVPEWTAQVELTCTSCHSIPPSSPHPFRTDCHTCHSNVDPASVYPNSIRFLDPQLHVNGHVEL